MERHAISYPNSICDKMIKTKKKGKYIYICTRAGTSAQLVIGNSTKWNI